MIFRVRIVALVLLVAPPVLAGQQVSLPVTVTTANETATERAAIEQLERLYSDHDIGRWTFTDRVVMADDVIPHSHPVLTLDTDNLDNDAGQLSSYVHEQFHWYVEAESAAKEAAMAEFSAIFPDAPGREGGGARNPQSTLLHLIVCDLEYQAMTALVGADQARTMLAALPFYRWVYERVLDDPRVRAVNARHGFLAALAGPTPELEVTLARGSEMEQRTEAQLRRLFEAHDLGRWTFTHRIAIEPRVIPHSHPVLTLNTRYVESDLQLLTTYVHEQFHWMEEAMPVQRDLAMARFREMFPEGPDDDDRGASDLESTYLHLIVCDLEYQAMTRLVGREQARAVLAAATHYEWIYAQVLNDPRVREVNEEFGFVVR